MNLSPDKIKTIGEATAVRDTWRNRGEVVVFTNGCFDILHLGHVDYLEKARNLGDKLIVGINSDLSVRKLKGKNRPVIDEKSRLRILAALQFVDMAILFEEETPINLITALLPDILVKGKDYEEGNIVGSKVVIENGGRVETIALVEGYSSSNIVKSIQGLKK